MKNHMCVHDSATHGSKACGFLSWEAPTLTLSMSETTEPIDTKFCTIDSVGDTSGSRVVPKVNNPMHGGAPTHSLHEI